MSSVATLMEPSTRARIEVDSRGTLHGTLSGENCPDAVCVLYNDTEWATVPSFQHSPGQRHFTCDLPPVGAPEDAVVSVYDALGGERLCRLKLYDRVSRLSGFGVSAHDIMALHGRPFYGIPYLRFDGAHLTLGGSHLPPCGDPSKLGVRFGPGVAYRFDYPLKSPQWGNHFWYWPNADLSDFSLTIDLPACAPDSDPFHFNFTYPSSQMVDLPDGVSSSFDAPYGHVWIPRDLSAYTGFPTESSLISRVQVGTDKTSVTLTGYNAFRAMDALLRRYGVHPDEGICVLDWGCGHGRVTRHFIRNWPRSGIVGMDIDSENIAWCQGNLRGGRFECAPLLPPSPLGDHSVDAVFGISVMTHLAEPIQQAWLKELARVLKPNGLAILSFGGPGAVAWSSIWHSPDYYEKWRTDGFHADLVDPTLDGKIDDPGYYRNVAQTWDYTLRAWSRYFDILTIEPEAIGNLDFAIMRKR